MNNGCRILVCSTDRSFLDHMHTWLHDDPHNYIIFRGDGFDRTLAQYQPYTFGLIVADISGPGHEFSDFVWRQELIGQLVLYIDSKPVAGRFYFPKQLLTKKPPQIESFLHKIAQILSLDVAIKNPE